MVRSPGCGLGLSNGVYCLIASCNTSSSPFAVARGYSRMYEHGKVCSVKENIDLDIAVMPNVSDSTRPC